MMNSSPLPKWYTGNRLALISPLSVILEQAGEGRRLYRYG